MADSGSTELAELVTLIEGHEQVDIRMALARIADGWQVLNGEVTLDAAMPTAIRTWRYLEEIFVQRRLPGPVIAALLREEPQNLDGLKVTAPPPNRNGTFNRVAGQHEWSHTVTAWPRTVWDVRGSDSTSTRQGGLLVGDGPSFVTFEAAFSAFFYDAAPSNLAGQHPLWRITRADRRAWLRRITIAPDTVTVAVEGTQLAGVSLELSTPSSQVVRPVGRTRRVRLRVSDGLPYSSLLLLRTDGDWLDYRYFITAAGRGRDASVVWLPRRGAGLLVAGGEGATGEFKQEIPTTTESRRKMLKTVAAFASGDGGTVLFGVDDDAQVVGIKPGVHGGRADACGRQHDPKFDRAGAAVHPAGGGTGWQDGATGRGRHGWPVVCAEPGQAGVLSASRGQHGAGPARRDRRGVRIPAGHIRLPPAAEWRQPEHAGASPRSDGCCDRPQPGATNTK